MNLIATGSATSGSGTLERRLFLIIGCLALIYAFLAGLRTVSDFDTGWQMATGRWVVQHHQVPSVDVLSYTANGQHWIYPVGAGVILYGAFLLGGFAMLSWMSAAACAGTIALLLRRGSAVGAVLAILAVPLIAERTPPRADMFSVILFAAFLSILWQNYRFGDAPLWLLPPLMVFWVNVHFGFAAGLGLIAAYVGTEVLEFVCGMQRRRDATWRLRHAWKWLLATPVATLLNPWGWGLYRALLLQQRANAEQQLWIAEWKGVRLNWHTASAAFTVGGAKGALFVLLAVAVVAGVIALFRLQLGAAILLLGSTYPPVQHIRMGSVFACVVVVVAGPVLTDAMIGVGSWIGQPRLRRVVVAVALAAVATLVWVRSADLVSNRFYFGTTPQLSTFGTGLGWWFPQGAAEFIQRENLPGEIFNTYDEGGYISWRLGPQRLDYIDGRDTLFGLQRVNRHRELLQSSPDSTLWQEETSRYHINAILLSRTDGIEHGPLRELCTSKTWRPVYLDEVSAIFVRRAPETESLIQRFPVDCAIESFSPPFASSDPTAEFISSSNAGTIFTVLGRNYDALRASEKAVALFPGSVNAHLLRAGALSMLDRRPEAEQELRTAIKLAPTEYTWSALANFYSKEDRTSEAIDALNKAADLQANPASTYLQLGYYALQAGHPDDALDAFNKAALSASKDEKKEAGKSSFAYRLATGQAAAWNKAGDANRAASFQEEAVQLAPDVPQAWLNLAEIYQVQGRSADADRAKEHAVSLTQNQNR